MTLADRSAMRFPMLIGRRALEGRFLIDPAQRHASSNTCFALDESDESDESVVSAPDSSSRH